MKEGGEKTRRSPRRKPKKKNGDLLTDREKRNQVPGRQGLSTFESERKLMKIIDGGIKEIKEKKK